MKRGDRDRWHQLDDAIGESNLPASDRAVFRQRLKRADYGTAELPARFTEAQAEVARAVGVTVRQVRRSERHLERHGWLSVSGTTGRGRKPSYRLLVGGACDCIGRVHELKADTGDGEPDIKADTGAPEGGHHVRIKADTKGGHSPGQRQVSTERHREERGGGQHEDDLLRRKFCTWCGEHSSRCDCWGCAVNDLNGCRAEEEAVRLVQAKLGGQVIGAESR